MGYKRVQYNCLYLLFASLFLLFTALAAQATTLPDSVDQALQSNPQLQSLIYNQRALEYDLKQAKGGYFPTIDLLLGYGTGQFSDDFTRRSDTDPDDDDWKSRSNASIELTQKIYDGGETADRVSISEAQLSSADYWTKATAQNVALEAITAHLNVFKHHELISLAEKNLQIHHNFYQSLADRERAGTGSLADVSQVQARLARAESTLYLSQADFYRISAEYIKVAGVAPKNLTYAADPDTVPSELATILQRLQQHNPELLAVSEEIKEANSRLTLARVNYKPKIDLELSSHYADNVDANESWQNSNTAMLNLRWNLFKGGQDKAGVSSALQHKRQSQSKRAAKLAELTAEAESTWAEYTSLRRQKAAYLDAVKYSRKTFEAYLKQFSFSQRSLLDVLSAENEYFQSAVRLIRVDINATLSAYHLLALSGDIRPSACTDTVPDFYHQLTQSLPMGNGSAVKPESTPPSATKPTDEQQIQRFVKTWVNAWQGRDITTYLRSYSDDFRPLDGKTHQQWQEQRINELTDTTSFELEISELNILKRTDSLYLARFIQSYRSNQQKDVVKKELLLEDSGDDWSILREQSQPVPQSDNETAAPEEAILPDAAIAALSADLTLPKTLKIGPCLNRGEVNRAEEILDRHKIDYHLSTGSGQVAMTHLREGIYPAAVAQKRLKTLKQMDVSASVVRKGKQLAVYVGSFHEEARATNFAEVLKQKKIEVTQIRAKAELSGKILTTKPLQQNVATEIAAELKTAHLPVTIFQQ